MSGSSLVVVVEGLGLVILFLLLLLMLFESLLLILLVLLIFFEVSVQDNWRQKLYVFDPTSNVSFACVRASLWQELAQPASYQSASPEGKIFWDCLQQHNPEYAAELVAGKKTMDTAEQELSIALKHLTGQSRQFLLGE